MIVANVPHFFFRIALLAGVGSLLLACSTAPRVRPGADPDAARASIAALLPSRLANRDGWAVDIFAAFEALQIEPTRDNTCAVLAVSEQESNFQADPPVAGLPRIARKELEARAASHNIPRLLLQSALELRSPDGQSYARRLDSVRTERQLSELYEDFIGMVPLGRRLLAGWNPVRTAGPMQVSIEFAERHAAAKRYPYPYEGELRNELFTRRGGLYFGIAHLLDYPANYDRMLYRFADFNAGHYASRNAAFQAAVSLVARTPLDYDGDLLRAGSSEPSQTELAVRTSAARLRMDQRQIRAELERGEDAAFADSRLYLRLFELADREKGVALPRALVPTIRLRSPKITRQLTTAWFAGRVDERYQRCLARDAGKAGRA
jgi:hypothetical protein